MRRRSTEQQERINLANRVRRVARRRMIAAYKTFVGCERCGFKDHAAALDLHHPQGHPVPAQRRIKAVDVAWAELVELDVLCANCHRIQTFNERHSTSLPKGSPLVEGDRTGLGGGTPK